MGKRPFDRRFSDPPSVALVRKAIIAVVAVHVPLALWSGYRAIVQVQHLELQSQARMIGEGSTVRVGVISSGRTTVDVRLEMIQGARVETLAVRDVPTGATPAYDPRFRHASLAVTLTPKLLERFEPGPALLRATAIGRSQWLRTPPPEVRELPVDIRHQPTTPVADSRR